MVHIKSPYCIGKKILYKKVFGKATVLMVLSKNKKDLITISKKKDAKTSYWRVEDIQPLQPAWIKFLERSHFKLMGPMVKMETLLRRISLVDLEQKAKHNLEWLIILLTLAALVK